MIPKNIQKQLKEVTKLKVVNTPEVLYRLDRSIDTLYVPICETNFDEMFSSCSNLKHIELSINNAINTATLMFYQCRKLEDIIFIEKLNLTNVCNLTATFSECDSLEYFNFYDILISKQLNRVIDLFSGRRNLRDINFGINFPNENIKDISFMFYGCTSLEKITWKDKQPFTNLKYMTKAFCGCNKLKQVDLRGINFNKVVNLAEAFNNTASDLKVLVNNTFREEILN